MKTANLLVLASLSLSSISLVAQQPGSSEPPPSSPPPPAAEQQQPATQTAPSTAEPNSGTAAASPAAMSPVNGELVNTLDTKTAKTGDSIVIKTKSATTTADGTQIPKGSKLIGHVTGVKPSGAANDNSQVALQFDRAELQGGQSLPIHSEIQSVAPSDSALTSSSPSSSPSMPGGAPAGGASGSSMNGGNPAASATAQPPSGAQMNNGASASANPGGGPAAGTVVARTGNIAIRTTSIPGVLLAVNEPGQQDPRMAQSSGILLGAKRDVHLDEGTAVVIGVSAAAANTGGN
jgi:hypothetical protein